MPAGVGHQIIHHVFARRNHVVKVAPGIEHLTDGDLKVRLRKILGARHQVLLSAGQSLHALSLELGKPLKGPFQAQMRAHSGDQLGAYDWLGNVIDSAHLKSLHLGQRVFVGGDKKNRSGEG